MEILKINSVRNIQIIFNRYFFIRLILIFFLLMSFKGLSQSDVTLYSKYNFENDDLLSQNEKRKFQSLSTTIKPSVYFENNQEKVNNEGYISLYIDYATLSNVHNLVQFPSSIEYISLKIKEASEINSNIDLTSLSNFVNARYIHIIFEYEINNNEVENLIVLPNTNCLVIYESRKIM